MSEPNPEQTAKRGQRRGGRQSTDITAVTPSTTDTIVLSHSEVDRKLTNNIDRAKKAITRGIKAWWELVELIAETHAMLGRLHRQRDFVPFLRRIPISRAYGFALLRVYHAFKEYDHIDRFDKTALVKTAAAPDAAATELKRLASEEGQYITIETADAVIASNRPNKPASPQAVRITQDKVPAAIVLHPKKACSAELLVELQSAVEKVVAELAARNGGTAE